MNNFAALTIAYLHLTTAIVITIKTNNPCHLTCYYTDKEPHRHRTARNQRGLTIPWGVYYCFVAWLSVEQIEAGDTLIHTFEVAPWSYCQTKWFAFRGTIADVLSPSVSCLFKHHHPGVLPALYEHLSTERSPMAGWMVDNVYWLGQTFTPSISHKITSVKFYGYRDLALGTITASVRATNAEGLPTGADLTSGTLDGNSLPIGILNRDWFEITIASYPLLANTKYAICLRPASGDIDVLLGTDNTYTRGTLCETSDSGASWSDWGGDVNDSMFEEWGIEI